jgi:hypothetical protein
MSGKLFRGWVAGAILWAACLGVPLAAQQAPPPLAPPAGVPAPSSGHDDAVVPAGCSTCGSGLLGAPAPDLGLPGCGNGCGGPCYPGRKPCDCCCDADGRCGRILCGIYQCICCPDPCYEPRWVALADSAFFADAPRPMTQMRFRYDHVWDMPFPDKAEFFWAKINGKGPHSPISNRGENAASYRDFSIYNEAARGAFGLSVEIPYRQVSPHFFDGASGLADLTIGTKSLLLDCELLQFAFGFKTFIPTGNFTRGLGIGHVSLEPSLLLALKLTPETYLQSELAYRFPLGGTGGFEGPVFHYHCSLNRQLWCCGHDIQLIGTAELNGYEFTGGGYTDPATGLALSAKDVGSILSIGPGIRLVICDKLDIGAGSAFNLLKDSVGDEWLRVEIRYRF